MFMFLILSTLLNQASSSFNEPISLSFPSFDPDSCTGGGDLYCAGGAAIFNGHIDITYDPEMSNATSSSPITNDVGRVLYQHPVTDWPASFVTSFHVIISKGPNSTGCGDGLAFVMAQVKGPCPAHSYGGFLGLFNKTNQGNTTHQLAVELDTFMNEFDPNDNHVGINTKSIISDATANLYDIGVDLKLGRKVQVKIIYDGWSNHLSIFAAYSGDSLKSILNRSIDIMATIPGPVYVGFAASTGNTFETHRIINWNFTSVPLPSYSLKHSHEGNADTNKILIITFPVVAGASVIALCTFLVMRRVRRWGKERKLRRRDLESESRSAANAPKVFTFNQLSRATQNFSKENLLGVGGFGSVYRGKISDPPANIAVKKVSATSKQGEREYLAEIRTIGRLRHKNLVQLQGWCHEHDDLLLVYDFMPNGSLDQYISKETLDWDTRYKILKGLASALVYLHEECGTAIVHRDVKPNNVMLDSNYNAHLGDFGLARLLQNEASVMTRFAGTPGYLAPECGYTGRANPECDVFSFGIVVLEVVSGKRAYGNIENTNLVDYIWSLYRKRELVHGIDAKLDSKFKEDEMKRTLVVGLSCSHPDPTLRPTMRKVVQVLTNPNEPLMDLPESRPAAIYLPVHSLSKSTKNALGATATMSFGGLSEIYPDETILQCGR